MASSRVGRPLKYVRFLELLEDDSVYSPASIVRLGETIGLFSYLTKPEELPQARLRVRHTLARFSSNHKFPDDGDGTVHIKGQAPIRGWKGCRWKQAAGILN